MDSIEILCFVVIKWCTQLVVYFFKFMAPLMDHPIIFLLVNSISCGRICCSLKSFPMHEGSAFGEVSVESMNKVSLVSLI